MEPIIGQASLVLLQTHHPGLPVAMCACVCACVHACARARACVCVRVCVRYMRERVRDKETAQLGDGWVARSEPESSDAVLDPLDTGLTSLYVTFCIGNLLATPEGDLAYLDFGMMSEAPPRARFALIAHIVHLVNRDYDVMPHWPYIALLSLSWCRHSLSPVALTWAGS